MQRPGRACPSLLGTRDLVEVCRLLHQAVERQMDATIFFLGLYDEASQTVEVVWQVENGEELSGGSFPLGKGLTSQVIVTGSSRLIRHWTAEGGAKPWGRGAEHPQKRGEPQEVEVELPGDIRRILSFRATPLHDTDG